MVFDEILYGEVLLTYE